MHYKNQREAKVGDQVVGRLYDGRVFAGTLVKAEPGSDTCNGTVVTDNSSAAIVFCNITIGELMHADDVLGAT